MTEGLANIISIATPFTILGASGLIAWGSHRQTLKTHSEEIEKKVDKDVCDANRKADKAQHEQIQNSLNTIEADVKELLKK